MKYFFTVLIIGLGLSLNAQAQTNTVKTADTAGSSTETIICLRHGEKPKGGLGQLNCQGLNRSLALPQVLLKKYGKPQFIFAPNPTQKVDGDKYYYVRPLETIEPTAIYCGLPVNTEFGFKEISELENELTQPQYRHAKIFVAWEHGFLDKFAKQLVKDHGGDPKQVPAWSNDEYDMIFVFKITTENGHEKFSFTVDHEGLNGLSDKYPESQKNE